MLALAVLEGIEFCSIFMAVPKYIALILRVALLGAAITMAALVNAPPMAMMGLALLTVAIVGREFISGHLTKIAPWMVLTGSCLAIVGMTIGRHSIFTFNSFFAFQAWLIAAAVFPQHLAEAGGTARAWKVLTIGWIFLGSFVLLGDGYLHNIPISFYAGLAAMLGLALWTKRWFRLRGFVVQILNTIILLIVGLPIVDALTRPRYNVAQHPDELRRYYSYSVAKKNPEAFRQWEEYSAEEWRRCEKVMIIREPTNFPSFRLRPNTRMKMFQAEYVINSLGFRGREIPVEKGNTYRIVAMGESTTFGISLTADHHPWPELLEGLIRERLKLSRPVEVLSWV